MINDSQTVGRAVSFMRQCAGMTAEDLAKKMRAQGFRWNTVTVSKIENGDRQLKLIEAAVMLQCMNRDTDELWLLVGSDEQRRLKSSSYELSDKLSEIAENLMDLDDLRANVIRAVNDTKSNGDANKEDTKRAIEEAEQLVELASMQVLEEARSKLYDAVRTGDL